MFRFSGIEERATEIVHERAAEAAVIEDRFRRQAMEERKKQRFKELLRAVEEGDSNEVKELINCGTDPNSKLDGVTPLIVSVTEGHMDILEFLIQDDVDLNGTGRFKMTALHHACHLNAYEVAKLLLQHGASPNPQTAFGTIILKCLT